MKRTRGRPQGDRKPARCEVGAGAFGHVIGIDMDAVLKIGAARGVDLAALSELLPAAEAGLVEALCSDRVRDDGP